MSVTFWEIGEEYLKTIHLAVLLCFAIYIEEYTYIYILQHSHAIVYICISMTCSIRSISAIYISCTIQPSSGIYIIYYICISCSILSCSVA